MKKITILLFTLVSVGIMACKKEKGITGEMLSGNWQIEKTKIITPGGSEIAGEAWQNGRFEFKADGDGAYYATDGNNVPYGLSWYLSGDHKKLTVSYDEVSANDKSFDISSTENSRISLSTKIMGPQINEISTQYLELYKIQ